MRLVALKSLRYNTRRLLPGEHFETKKDSDGRILIAVRRARHINDRERVEIAPPPDAVLAKARRSDPFDHDKNGAPGGSSKPADPATPELRAEYQEKMGKRPFSGWDAAELRRRMAAAE